MSFIAKLGSSCSVRNFELVMQPYDVELKIGSTLITILWGGMPGDGGLFIEGPDWSWHRTWDGLVTVSQRKAVWAEA